MNLRILILLLCLFLISCGKQQVNEKEVVSDEDISEEYEDTLQLSPKEAFSFTLINNFLETDDDDLQIYLEEEIFPLISKSEKITIDKVSASLYLLTYDLDNQKNNILIQKFYNPGKDMIFFTRETVSYDARNQFIR